ncbi:PREDICTED: phospho-N-acetylmuramoyl-pentapeptide-transferase homolog [Tarenaya hassleriana]|uniref:phospho-N-acetylmuramoyl-pentapeptide- transferase homolog n=1 Tax=Tarenaya hassleriana TaxID=28532 RepID=UPI00053C7B26|nr:PREDICTED: phospho-N-acetylmuramoyl-pentapeptide-transferase homolog [Tarenaya hassleriana]
MRSLSLSSSSYWLRRPTLLRSLEYPPAASVSRPRFNSGSRCSCKFKAASFQRHGCGMGRSSLPVKAFDGDSFDFASIDIFAGTGTTGYAISSSEGEESDGEYALNVVTETTAQRLGRISRSSKKHRYGMFINLGLLIFLSLLLLFMDCFAWKIVRLPLPPLFLSRPFFISAVMVTFVGYIFVPLLDKLKVYQSVRIIGPNGHHRLWTIPTMGGLFFIPIGIAVAEAITRFSSIEVSGAAVATLAFTGIGLVDDSLNLHNGTTGLSAKIQTLLEIAVGTCFGFWLDSASISSPYGMKTLVPLPSPIGLVCLGQFYVLMTFFCFVSMGNMVKVTDGVDGLAGGVATLAFVAMAIAVLPICSDLSVFGTSMAGACFGFLIHNRYKASVSMGNTGSLAIGGALAAMAASTGMFFPLLISSGVFIFEAASVIVQVAYYKATKGLKGRGRRVFRRTPFHHHLELCGMRVPVIVAMAYAFSSLLSLSAAYVALISA